MALFAGFLLRLYFAYNYPLDAGDGPVYANIARNWFFHGGYALSVNTGSGLESTLHATIIRLPGYPFFLGVCFTIFGHSNTQAVMLLQAILDLFTCLLIAAVAKQLCGTRAARWALWLAVLCPFTAVYTAAILSESLEMFSSIAALYCFLRLMDAPPTKSPRWLWAALLALSTTYAALLRPDGALIGVVLYPAIFLYGRRVLGSR